MKNIIIYNHDIQKYPPIISAINFLLNENKSVSVIGYCSNKALVKQFKDKGVEFFETKENVVSASFLRKFLTLIQYKLFVLNVVNKIASKDSLLWIYGNQNSWLLHSLVPKYKSIIYLFEIPRFKVSLRYKIISPSLNYKKLFQSAFKIVCCENTRGQITKAYFNLQEDPIIIPNKPDYPVVKDDKGVAGEVLGKISSSKKIILYQGIFNQPERRLDELCESIKYLSEEFVICIMGPDDHNKKKLIQKYASERVLFLPYLPAPSHMLITQKAYMGFLSYFPTDGILESSLNTLFCAPNKIFEYTKFGVPMISNNVPALKSDFNKFRAGISVNHFTALDIANAIKEIDSKYDEYSKGSLDLFNSVDINKCYQELIK